MIIPGLYKKPSSLSSTEDSYEVVKVTAPDPVKEGYWLTDSVSIPEYIIENEYIFVAADSHTGKKGPSLGDLGSLSTPPIDNSYTGNPMPRKDINTGDIPSRQSTVTNDPVQHREITTAPSNDEKINNITIEIPQRAEDVILEKCNLSKRKKFNKETYGIDVSDKFKLTVKVDIELNYDFETIVKSINLLELDRNYIIDKLISGIDKNLLLNNSLKNAISERLDVSVNAVEDTHIVHNQPESIDEEVDDINNLSLNELIELNNQPYMGEDDDQEYILTEDIDYQADLTVDNSTELISHHPVKDKVVINPVKNMTQSNSIDIWGAIGKIEQSLNEL